MNKKKSDILQVLVLIIISIGLYGIHLLIFKDFHHITIFALEDLAFVPIEVIFVTLIFHRVIKNSERKQKIGKLYMVVEMFFSEIGTELLRAFACNDKALAGIRDALSINNDWTDKDFKNLIKLLEEYEPKLEIGCDDFQAIDMMLLECRPDLLRLLENPILLEHETFTEVLMSVFHLAEELRMRYGFTSMKPSDQCHLVSDVKSAYKLLSVEWVYYVNHMRVHYPSLYSLSVRNHPFSRTRDVEIKE